MRNLYLIVTLIFFTNFLIGSSDSIVNNMGNQFEEYLEYNSTNEKGNFFLYFSEKFQSKPQMAVMSNWFEESMLGLTPFKTEIVDILNEYNNKEFEIEDEEFTGRLQHYVVVADIAWTKSWNESKIKDKIEEGDLTLKEGETTHDLSFKAAVETEINSRISNWKRIPSSDPVKYYISFVFVNKKLGAGGFVEADISINRARAPLTSDKYYSKFADYNKEIYKNYLFRKELSLAVVYEEVNLFINYFWGTCNNLTPCSNIGGNVNSNIAGQFITEYCTVINEANDPFDEKKQILLHAASFLDLLMYASEYNTYVFDWDFKGNNHIGSEVDIKSHWWDIGTNEDRFFEFLHLYFNSPSPPQYHDYLKNYYDLHLANDDLSSYEKKYLKYFININCPNNVLDLIEDLEGSLSHYKIDPISSYLGVGSKLRSYAELIEGVGNYFVNSDFDDQLACANDLVTNDQQVLVDHFLSSTFKSSFEDILWTEILSPTQNEVPFLGPATIEMAGKLSNLIVNAANNEIPYRGDDDPNDGVNSNTVIVTSINKTLFPDKVEIPSVIHQMPGKIITQTSYEATVTRNGSELTFDESYCSALKYDLFGVIGVWFNDDCMLSQNITEEIGKYDFFDIVYAVEVKDPGFFEDGCFDNSGNTCKNNINLECAFMTAARINQERFDLIVNDATNIIGVVTLPFSVGAMTSARGLQFLKHGIYVANDVTSLLIQSQDQVELKEKFESTFGANGQVFFTSLIQFTAIIGGIDLADVLVSKSLSSGASFKTIKGFTDDELVNRIAVAKYCHADNIFNGTQINQGELLMKKSMVGTLLKMEATVISRKPAIAGIIEQKLKGLYPSLKGINVLSEEGKDIRRLIHSYRNKQVKINGIIDPAQTIDAVIDGMTAAKIKRLKLALKNHPGLDNILTGLDNQTQNINRIKAWNVVDELNETIKSDFSSIIKLSDGIVKNPGLADFLINNSQYYPTWKNIEYSTYSHNEDFIKTLKQAEDIPFNPGTVNVPFRHFINGDITITFKHITDSNNNIVRRYPASTFLDLDPTNGGLVSDIDFIRQILNDANYKPPSTNFSGMHSGSKYIGDEFQFAKHGTILSPSTAVTQITDKFVLGDGSILKEIINPGVKVISTQGWTKIKNSSGGLPSFDVNIDLQWKKKPAGISTMYSINASVKELQEIGIEAFVKRPIGQTGASWTSIIQYRGSAVEFGGFIDNLGIVKSSYIVHVN